LYRPSAALFNTVLYFKRVCLVLLISSFEGADPSIYIFCITNRIFQHLICLGHSEATKAEAIRFIPI